MTAPTNNEAPGESLDIAVEESRTGGPHDPPTPPGPIGQPVRFAHPQRCLQKLDRGTAKRMFARGPLHGYYVACPGCGFTTLHFQDAGRFVEDGEADGRGSVKPGGAEVAFRHPRLVGSEELRCPACRVGVRVEGGRWVSADVGSGA